MPYIEERMARKKSEWQLLVASLFKKYKGQKSFKQVLQIAKKQYKKKT